METVEVFTKTLKKGDLVDMGHAVCTVHDIDMGMVFMDDPTNDFSRIMILAEECTKVKKVIRRD